MENKETFNSRKKRLDKHNKDRIGVYGNTSKENEKSMSYRNMEQLCQMLKSILN